MNKKDIIIIGSGPAGLTAAVYAARANLKTLVIAGETFGGQLMTTTQVENFPGFPEGIGGPQLMENILGQAEKYGAEILYENADSVEVSGDLKRVKAGEEEYEAPALILATGSSPRKLGVRGEEEFWGKGVHSCATCDGFYYKGKTVAVVGGGDAAMEEALFLSQHAAKVLIIHRREKLRSSGIVRDRVVSLPNVQVIYNSEVREVIGQERTTGIKIWDNAEKIEKTIPLDAVFLAIGQIPNTAFLAGQVELGPGGIIKSDGTSTPVKGVFVAGDAGDEKYRQAVVAAGMGAMAAIDATAYVIESRK
jgi:thioredoxin reductase (NADPH)